MGVRFTGEECYGCEDKSKEIADLKIRCAELERLRDACRATLASRVALAEDVKELVRALMDIKRELRGKRKPDDGRGNLSYDLTGREERIWNRVNVALKAHDKRE